MPPYLISVNSKILAITLLLSLSVCSSYANDEMPLAGVWHNPEVKTQDSMKKINITKEQGIWLIEVWVSSDPKDRMIAKMPLMLLGDYTICPSCIAGSNADGTPKRVSDEISPIKELPPVHYGFAHKDFGFSDFYLTIKKLPNKLVVDDYTLFKDGSNRPNYKLNYEMVRPKE